MDVYNSLVRISHVAFVEFPKLVEEDGVDKVAKAMADHLEKILPLHIPKSLVVETFKLELHVLVLIRNSALEVSEICNLALKFFKNILKNLSEAVNTIPSRTIIPLYLAVKGAANEKLRNQGLIN